MAGPSYVSERDQVGDAFDLDQPWGLNPLVSVRPEPFGALLYHFGTRRLSFLKDPRLREVVSSLDEHASARTACAIAGVPQEDLASFAMALHRLATTDMVVQRTCAIDGVTS